MAGDEDLEELKTSPIMSPGEMSPKQGSSLGEDGIKLKEEEVLAAVNDMREIEKKLDFEEE